jgi:transposase-like protein
MPDSTSSNNRPKRYPAELKERAVRMVFETIE